MTRMVNCIKLGSRAEGLDKAPYPGELGQRLHDSVSKAAWRDWLAHQTTLINENRLNPLDPKARAFLRSELEQYFFGGGSAKPAGFVAVDPGRTEEPKG